MNIDDFIIWIQERHNDLTRLGEEEIRKHFGGFDGESLEKVKESVEIGYTFQKAPSVAKLKELTQGVGLKRDRVIQDKNYAYLCKSCGTLYRGRIHHYDAYSCPVCQESTNGHRTIANPQGKILYVQSPCAVGWSGYIADEENGGYCPKYKKNPIGKTGPSCNEYGFYQSIRGCEGCLCRDCCKAFTNEREQLQ